MRKRLNHLKLTLCMVLMLGSHSASAVTSAELEALFNGAESIYPQFFPNHQITQKLSPWTYRYYPSTGIYVGEKNNEIFVLGGVFGDNPAFVGTAPDLIAQIVTDGGSTNVPNCKASDLPEGLVITQSGNVVNITTNGQCIKIPADESNNFCEVPPQNTATGISVLSQTDVTNFEAKGITISVPNIPNPLDSAADGLNNLSCTINAPEQFTNQVVNADICLDMTDQFSSLPAIPSGGFVVEPPVTIKYKATSTAQVVSDCFATNAQSIHDAFTDQSWVRVNGQFVQTGF